ncbi:SOS response-associated peptidase [Fervidibacillus halotolerans]|uniref:Abasic site processing protein n=1 Tax=Fervidibacillus halotolerans TaxID=2980027 RepID=A0A9E8M129_9BACI|nr:SOS response-associated peptidase [Fervidibacillus halotolerans]WAA13279.1 SOS response-associated peptidase [Fervidibacillus halotolerans]
MCGRFTLTADRNELIEAFQLDFFPDEYEVSYNIAPTQPILAAVQGKKGRKAGFLTWGLVPYWVKVPKKWKPLINARSESLAEKSSFRHLLARRRCVIFADSFYEWKAEEGKKIPYRIMLENGRPFAFAGLWDRNEHGEEKLTTCTILTTKANERMHFIHERMPVILYEQTQIEKWLNVEQFSFEKAKMVLTSMPDDTIKLYRVSSIVNSPKNNRKECILPV